MALLQKHRILILGVSGFLGNAIYKELCPYYSTFGTYRTPLLAFENNKQFYQYDFEEDDIFEILDAVKPTLIISALRGDFSAQLTAHKHLFEYISLKKKCKMVFLSSANVFDAYSKYPSYENDTTLSNSIYGHFKIRLEQLFLKLPSKKIAILRLPMVFGAQSPRVNELKLHLELDAPIELFPNLIMNVISDQKVTQQLHYIINRNKYGIFHVGSKDLVHHDDFIKDLVSKIGAKNPKFKLVYTTNDERYLAVLPKENKLPKHLQMYSLELLDNMF
ncbi:MAG: sugar nucleotide-binding protein [Flavobacteriaceae bacterium]|jgi:dTDP-4-dehydrorhamnose reductase|nr:sugar nucleotide-binding protein [Flavobacteriaceae bacterium]MDG1042959.1 sugar nucleotide-binding protein [Flavobacteriaceae bacterium]